MGFTVYLPPDDDPSGLQWGSPSPMLRLERKWHRSSVFGGPVGAEVAVYGPLNALWEIMEWLRRPIEIYNLNGLRVWHGMVHEVRIMFGVLTVGLSLDKLRNSVAVTYSYTGPTGATVRGTTTWVQDASSVARYGIKEFLDSMGEGNAAAAAARQLRLLADYATPPKVASFGESGEGAPSGLVIGVGWIETLRWRKFIRLEGRIEYEGTATGRGSQPVGWGITTSNRIGFATKAIHDIDGRLGALSEGAKVAVSGSPSNSTTLSPTGNPSGDKTVRASSAFHFEASDDILDGSATPGLGFIRAGAFIQVQGSTLNSRYHLINTTGDDHVTTQVAVTGAILAETPALTTITQGHSVQVAEALTTEIVGANNITLRLYGYELAQAFVANQTMLVDKIGLKVGVVGAPTDSFEVDLWSDSGSLPGAQLIGTTLLGSSMASNATWTWFDEGNVVTITATLRYWIKMRRTGALDPLNYYTIEMVKFGYDLTKAWTGSAWVAHPQGWSVPFKMWGGEDTALQARRILADKGQFFAGIEMQVEASGVETNPYRNGDLTAYDELMKLLGAGTSAGQRMLCNVTAERVAQVYVEPNVTDDGDRYQADGSIRNVGGGRRASGWLPAGEWLAVDGVPSWAATGITPVFVDDAECGEDGDVYKITPKSAG